MNSSDERLLWINQVGQMWTNRNKVDWEQRIPTFRTLLANLEIKSILEVGCNRGYNLEALKQVGEYEMTGMDICSYPLLSPLGENISFIQGDIQNLPFKDNSFDLVLSVGVLMIFGTSDLLKIAKEVYRVSCRYFLAIEYPVLDPEIGEKMLGEFEVHTRYIPTPTRWWESMTIWWQRDYSFFLPGFVDRGILGSETGFDRCGWWLFDKKLAEA